MPSLGSMSPQRSRSKVVLPHPDGPTRASTSPLCDVEGDRRSAPPGHPPRSACRAPTPAGRARTPACLEHRFRLVSGPVHRTPRSAMPAHGARRAGRQVERVPEQAEEEDAGVHLGDGELTLLHQDVVAEAATLADELGDDDQHEADRERDPKPGSDRRKRGRQVDAKDAFRPPTCSIEAVSRASGRYGTNARHRVDENRKADAEGDQLRSACCPRSRERVSAQGRSRWAGSPVASSINGSSAA